MIRLTTSFLACGVLLCPALAAAQEAPTRLSYFPYLTASPNDGVMGIARAIWFQQAGWGGRIVNNHSVAVEAGYSTKDAWLARVIWSNPTLADGWRLKAFAEIGHTDRFGDPALELPHDRKVAWVDLTRRIRGPLHFAIRAGYRHDDIPDLLTAEPLPGEILPGQFSYPSNGSAASLRGALVLDLRDREYDVNSGVFAEVGLIGGTGGESANNYTVPYGQLKAYVTPFLPLRLTGRAGWRGKTDDGSATAPRLEFPAWEDSYDILGGHRTHRGLATNQLTGDGVAFAGAEARFDIVNVGEMGAITFLAFVDAVKMLNNNPLDTHGQPIFLPTEWRVGAGGGIALRVMRQAVLTITAAGGDGETRWYVGSGWSW